MSGGTAKTIVTIVAEPVVVAEQTTAGQANGAQDTNGRVSEEVADGEDAKTERGLRHVEQPVDHLVEP